MKVYSFLFFFLFIPLCIFSQKIDLDYYFQDIGFDKNIPTPKEVLGYEPGEWHVSHDQLVHYMYKLAASSQKVKIEEYARTYENRPLILLTISSIENQLNLSSIKNRHQGLTNPEESKTIDLTRLPSVIYQGYTVHGDEASGANAAILYAYYLVAGKGRKIDKLLDEVVILLDPCMNPDGMQRFSTWVNMHKSKNLVHDPTNIELNQAWPRGRTNHYWFDLNRDWLLVQHPESQGRIRIFQEWKPNILTDHHEMGSNNTFFFQPGVPDRTNPLTPKANQELTSQISKFHARALDQIGSLYYSKESFDDFYYGKGSTYPDVNGGVGILFEQASSRGHLQETDNGLLSFPFTIRNQLMTSFSTLEAAKEMRQDLLSYKREFFRSALADAKQDDVKAFIFEEIEDKTRLTHFLELLKRHQIKIYELSKNIRANGQSFDAEHSYVVPLDQTQYRLIKAIFNISTSFKDSLFYDVSSWTIPLAFNLKYTSIQKKEFSIGILGAEYPALRIYPKNEKALFSSYAYLFTWDDYNAPKALNFLLSNNLITKVSTQGFQKPYRGILKTFEAGTVLIKVQNQEVSPEKIFQLIQKAEEFGVQFYDVNTSLTPSGIDLGSPSFENLKKPEVLMPIGNGVRAYDAGEVWHLLDQRYDMQLTMVDVSRLDQLDLNRYNSIVLVDGNYNEIEDKGIEYLKTWLEDGGNLICMKRAITWAKSKGLVNVTTKTINRSKTKKKKKRKAYAKIGTDNGSEFIGGAIFQGDLDLSHPLAYGYRRSQLPIFRRGTLFLEPAKNEYATPLVYTSDPLLSGYISKNNYEKIKDSAGIIVGRFGSGKIICLVDNPNFRAFWHGTNKLFANSIFFGHIINSSATESQPTQKKVKNEK